MASKRILLIHWNAAEAKERAGRLRKSGYKVAYHCDETAGALRKTRENPPDAFVVDLGRLPAQGRALAVWLRQQKATRRVPIVFVEGDPEKTRVTREMMPDAVFAPWRRINAALREAIERPPANPVVPGTMDGYAGTPLVKKLGIKDGCALMLLGAPAGFDETLGKLPGGVRVESRARRGADVIVLFVRSAADLRRRFPAAARALVEGGRLWIAWPKQASGVDTDLTQASVRRFGLDAGLVDYKIGAIDETWSGLCFTQRRGRRSKRR